MSAEPNIRPTPALPQPQPNDLLAEGARARKLSADVAGVKSIVEGIRLINDTILTQVLFALWDSGFYEFSLTHPRFAVERAASELHLDAKLLGFLMDYLIGRGIMDSIDGQLGLTDHGTRLSNVLLRGTMNLYVGGWGPQLANIGPLLRKEMTPAAFKKLRSGRHTVMGTEQLISVRSAPAILKILNRRNLHGVLHIACRTGQFLIELARSDPALHGVGIEKDPHRVTAAKKNAQGYGVDSRLQFVTADYGSDPLPLDARSLKKIDVVVALYLLHEVARHGRQKVVDLLKQTRQLFPGRLFLFMETLPAGNAAPGNKPTATFSQLDYLLVHRIRDQGLPLPSAEWKAILQDAGVELLEVQEVYWAGVYLAQL